MFILFIIGCIFVGILLAGIIAPILMISDGKKLTEMKKLISEFDTSEFASSQEKEEARNALKRKLVEIKSNISTSNKQATEQARDLVASL